MTQLRGNICHSPLDPNPPPQPNVTPLEDAELNYALVLSQKLQEKVRGQKLTQVIAGHLLSHSVPLPNSEANLKCTANSILSSDSE